MGELAEERIDQMIDGEDVLYRLVAREWLDYPHLCDLLKKDYWVTADGRRMYPARPVKKGGMELSHIQAVKRMLTTNEAAIKALQNSTILKMLMGGRPFGDHAQEAFDREVSMMDEMTPEQFAELYIKESTLWKVLCAGERKREKELQKAQNLNAGILKW